MASNIYAFLNAMQAQNGGAALPFITMSTKTSTKRTFTTIPIPPRPTVAVFPQDNDGNDDNGEKEEEEPETMPWEDEDFVPETASGKQKSPNMIRNELQRYIDTSGRTQTAIIQEMGVNNNTFRRFMNPKTYKNQWSAVENGTYWAAARLLARVQHEEKVHKKKQPKQQQQQGASSSNKRKAVGGIENFFEPSAKKAKSSTKSAAEKKAEVEEWMRQVMATPAPNAEVIYDSCPQLVKKIKDCLQNQEGMTKAAFCRIALDGANHNSLARFLAAKKQDQQASAVYKLAYTFFEKLRIKNGQGKSKERLKNEEEQGPGGFSTRLVHVGTQKFVYLTPGEVRTMKYNQD